MIIDRNSDIFIVVPKAPTTREVFAADELKLHLSKILGVSAKIITDDTACDGLKFLIGGPSHNAASAKLISSDEFNAAVPGPEGMMIKAFGNDTVMLAGSENDPELECERGTLYAVYELLERYAGASFAAFVNPEIAGGDEIPEIDALDLDGIEYIKAKADSPYRTAIVQYADSEGQPIHNLNLPFLDWLCRNRYNRILTWAGVYRVYKQIGMLEEAEKRGLRFTVGHHSATREFLPPYGNDYFPEHYAETHPEYYKQNPNGTRFVPSDFYGQWILCSRNAGLIEVISNNIINWISNNPAVDIIAFWPQDGRAEQCMCDECQKYSKVANYTYFLNEAAKRVSAVYPHVKIDMLAYVDLWEPVEGQTLEPSLMVDEATWASKGLRNAGAPDGSGIVGTFFEDNLLKWHKLGAEVVYYDYYMGVYGARQRLVPMADEIQAIAKSNRKHGIMGSGTQIECFNMWNNLFNFYCFGRTQYDDSLDIDANFDRFGRIFGNGAEHMRKIMHMTEKACDGQVPIHSGGIQLMKNIDKAALYSLFDAALDSAGTPSHRNNIRMMRMAFRYTDVEVTEASAQGNVRYSALRKYDDETGELYFLSQYDSFMHNDPGYGIAIPVDVKPSDRFVPDRWYEFEHII